MIDRILVKNILDIFITMGMDTMECYEQDFEQDMLEATSQYYKVKAAAWIMDDSCPEYMIKAEECLRQEEDRIQSYLDVSSKKKLLKRVETELLTENKDALLYKANSGCQALLTDDKVRAMRRKRVRKSDCVDGRFGTDVSSVYSHSGRLRSHRRHLQVTCRCRRTQMCQGRDSIDRGTSGCRCRWMSLRHGDPFPQRCGFAVRPGRDSAVAHEQQFVRHIIALHDKYMEYVVTCFSNNPLFHRAMTEACEGFCQKNVAGTSTAELFANFCDNLLKKAHLCAHIARRDVTCDLGRKRTHLRRSDRVDIGKGGEAPGLYQRQRSVCRVLSEKTGKKVTVREEQQ